VKIRILSLFALAGLLCTIAAQAGPLIIHTPLTSGTAAVTDLPRVKIRCGGDGAHHFHGEGLHWIGEPGQPRIPWRVTTLLLPPGTDTTTLACRLSGAVYEQHEGIFDLEPLPPPQTRTPSGTTLCRWTAGADIVDGRDRSIYGTSGFWPFERVRVLGCGRLHGWRLCEVGVPLARWDPASGTLAVLRAAELHLDYRHRPGRPDIAPGSLRDRERVAALAINFASAAQAYGNGRPGRAEGYTIISTSEIVNDSTTLAAFIAHKESLGFTVKLVTEDDFGGGTGDMAAENIRGWLQANYLADQTRWVLLIGNPHPGDGAIPMKRCYDSVDGMYEMPTDFFFSDLSGNWDLNQDGNAGQWEDMGDGGIDRYWEVVVGRIPHYGQIADTDHILQKIIDFEQETDIFWRRRALLPMVPLDDATQSFELGEQIKQHFLEPAAIPSHRLYHDDYGLVPEPESIPCSYDNVIADWTAEPTGLVVWSTHGWEEGGAEVATSDTILALDDDHPGATFQGSCSNATPEHTRNIAYALLRHGAIATMGASRSCWYYVGETNYTWSTSSGGLGFQYAGKLVEGQPCGAAWADVRQELTPGIWSNFALFNLYGDPSVVVMPPPPAFTVSPTDLFAVSGVRHEAWSEGQRTFILRNNGDAPFNWSATADVSWLTCAPASGSLAAGGEARISVTLSVTSGEIPVGAHEARIIFTGAGSTIERKARVTVEPRVMTIHWKMDEESGFIAYDSSGFDHRGFLEGGMRFQNDAVPGRFGGALRFDENGYRVNMEHLDIDDIPAPWTAAMWIRKTENITGSSCLFASSAAALRLEQWNNDEMGITVFGGDDPSFGYSAPVGQWVHLALVGNGPSTSLYVNSLHWSTVDAPIAMPMNSLCTSLLRLAAEVDDVRIYNHTLSVDAIGDLQRGGRAANPTPADGSAGITDGTALAWVPGISATSHDVYFGTDADAVASADTSSPEYMGRQPGTEFQPALAPGTTCYWRVDEVTFGGGGLPPIQGDVWTFSTATVETVSVDLDCVPTQGTLPFGSQFAVTLTNLTPGENRRVAARMDVLTAGGQSYPGWRAGWSNLDDGESFTVTWAQPFPALGALVGANSFTLHAEDVTPPPWNQPPYQPAGGTDSDTCMVTGLAP